MSDSLKNFAKLVDDTLQRDRSSFDALCDCGPLLRQAVSDGLHLVQLHDFLRKSLNDGWQVTPNVSSGPYFVLAGSETSTWAILKHSSRSPTLYFNPSHTIAVPITSNLWSDMYVVEGVDDLSILNPNAQAARLSSSEASIDAVVAKDGARNISDVFPVSGIGFSLRVNTLPFADFEWCFDRESLRPQQVLSTNPLNSNINTILETLGSIGHPASADEIEPFAEHPEHYVRWRAIQSLGRIDRRRGLALATRALSDGHPDVRSAASTTLARAALA